MVHFPTEISIFSCPLIRIPNTDPDPQPWLTFSALASCAAVCMCWGGHRAADHQRVAYRCRDHLLIRPFCRRSQNTHTHTHIKAVSCTIWKTFRAKILVLWSESVKSTGIHLSDIFLIHNTAPFFVIKYRYLKLSIIVRWSIVRWCLQVPRVSRELSQD
jgi:hypothetical protein